MGEGKLYENQPPFNLDDMFKNPLWHIHVEDELRHFCFIHGVNLWAGGIVFDTAEKFSELYFERINKAKNFALTDVTVKGVSLMNLRNIVYYKPTDMWYSPNLVRTIERLVIKDMLDKDFTLDSLFDTFGGDRYLVQSVDLIEILDKNDPRSKVDQHISIFAKVDGKWYLLDVTMKEPLDFSKYPKKVLDWLFYIDYMNVFVLEPKKLSLTKSRPLVEQWDRIMEGLPARKKGGNYKKGSNPRSQGRKDRRSDIEAMPVANVGKRRSDSSEPLKKKRLSGNKFAGGLGPNLSDKVIKEVKDDRTKPATAKRHPSTKSQKSGKTSHDTPTLKRVKMTN